MESESKGNNTHFWGGETSHPPIRNHEYYCTRPKDDNQFELVRSTAPQTYNSSSRSPVLPFVELSSAFEGWLTSLPKTCKLIALHRKFMSNMRLEQEGEQKAYDLPCLSTINETDVLDFHKGRISVCRRLAAIEVSHRRRWGGTLSLHAVLSVSRFYDDNIASGGYPSEIREWVTWLMS